MKKRIGNDIQFTWHIYRKSGETQTPESFDGKDVEVKLISPLRQPVTIEDVSIATGVVTFTFRGKHQVTLGNYVAVLLENKGENGMVTLDVVNAVTLVPHSYMEEDGDDGDVIEASSVELTSTINAGGGGGFVQQQADWAQTDDAAVDFIKNKPDLGLYVPKTDDNGHGSMSIYSPGTIMMTLADEQGIVNQTGSFWAGGWSVSSLDGRFQTFGNSIYRGTIGFDHDSVVWEKTATQQIPTATTEANGLMSAEDKQKITDIEAVIPEQASSSNKLADKNFVNSSIATATATYRGAYNLVTDLHLSISATHAQIATALATAIQTADNNDYCFVQIPVEDATPTEIASVERYKFNGTAWEYEYTLNNSGYTAAQWAALNSGITSGLVDKLSALPADGYAAADVSYDNTHTGLSAINVQAAIDEMADTNLYETVVLTIGSADSSFNPVGQTITVTLEDGSATQYTVPMSRQITFIVQRGMRYTISGTSTDDYRVLPISVKAAIPTRYLTMRYIPIATGVFILQKDGTYYLREEYDAETMAEDAVGVLVLTSALIDAGHGIVINKSIKYAAYTSWTSANDTSTTSYNGLARTERMAAGNAACAVWCYGLRLAIGDRELVGYIGSYAEGNTVYKNVTEINLCMVLIGGYSIPSDGHWRTSTHRQIYGTSARYYVATNTGTFCDQYNYDTLPFFYYEL